MLIALVGDIHIGLSNDDHRVRTYQLKFFKEILFPELKKRNIKNIMFLMDIFDRRKYLNNLSFNDFKKEVFDYLEKEDINIDVGPGNHDIYLKNSLKINSIDLYLKQYKNINIILEPTELQYGSTKFLYMPWITEENYNQSMEAVDKTDATVLVSHLELKGFLDGAALNEHGMDASLFKKFDKVYSGHFHNRSNKGNISYLGTPYETSWACAGDTKSFYIFDTETQQLEEIVNPYTMHEKIFYDDVNPEFLHYLKNLDYNSLEGKKVKVFVQKKTNKELFENFIENLYKINLTEFQILEDVSSFHESQVETTIDATTSTGDLINQYIDNVETEMDKTRLKSMTQRLYLESLMDNHE